MLPVLYFVTLPCLVLATWLPSGTMCELSAILCHAASSGGRSKNKMRQGQWSPTNISTNYKEYLQEVSFQISWCQLPSTTVGCQMYSLLHNIFLALFFCSQADIMISCWKKINIYCTDMTKEIHFESVMRIFLFGSFTADKWLLCIDVYGLKLSFGQFCKLQIFQESFIWVSCSS